MKKKIFALTMVISMLFSCIAYANEGVSLFAVSGKGTEANPFRITNEEELLLLADFPECYFELENDIELTSAWEPVADFSGYFNGKGHTITVSEYVEKYKMGFFGILNGTVENLTFNAVELEFSNSGFSSGDKAYAGVIAGKVNGTVRNCKVVGNINVKSADYSSVGVICGTCSGTIEKTISEAVISSERSIGGICSTLQGTVSECAVFNDYIKNSSIYGLVESLNGGEIINSYNFDKNVSTKSVGYRGIAGSNGGGKIINCYSRGISGITGTKYGISSGGTMTNCYYDKVVLGNTATAYGTPKSTLAMKMQVTYKDWDFENIWGLDESEENPINDGYPYLKWMHENAAQPVTLSSAKAVAGNIVFDVKITDITDIYMLHIALYNSNNELCDYIVVPNERLLKDAFVVFPDNNGATSAKIFTWNEENKIEPVAKNELIQIER